ncbi:hypothetical protein BJ973_002696 [Actinoplanes tereljensis]|uniref:FtsX extracellular domain-containing protein n=1 Tax=Paractinoplanes tereljensis TaxID=571912 RepID=A0A919NPN1_9ACTN|nr:permease-like cell division protein FtsX [Actinoplanes tereljensis]GIF22373.1 hypothetical protein Ate02nite_51030 [Actinoplanes tereljensis]
MTDVVETQAPRPVRLWPVALIVAALSLLLGAVIGVGGPVLAGWQKAERRDFVVWVLVKNEATPEQRDAIGAVLRKIRAKDAVKFVSSAEDLANARKDPGSAAMSEALAGADVTTWPQRFELTVTGIDFRCDQLAGLRGLAGLDRVRVGMVATASRPGMELVC